MNRKKSTFYPLIQFENKVIVYRGPLVVVDTVIVKKKNEGKTISAQVPKWTSGLLFFSPKKKKNLLLNYS